MKMCPISGMVQFLIVAVALLLLCHVVVVRSLKATFEPNNTQIHMYDTVKINYKITENVEQEDINCYVQDLNIAHFQENVILENPGVSFSGSFNLTGVFLGKTSVYCKTGSNKVAPGNLDVTVIREVRVIDTIFTVSVATLVSIIYINFGCALNWGELIRSLKRPVGPTIGFIGQFLFMPLISFGCGQILFPDSPEMQLGMFFTGVSPGGGASNIWTAVLDGNIDLSITMTTISTFAAFGMMPLWLFTLGQVIFDKADITVPYSQISKYAIALVIPLGIGFLISRYLKKVAHFLVRILKGFSGMLLLFIVIFAIIANLYLFQLFSWKIVVAGMGLPYLGYLLGYLLARVFKQPAPNCLAIAIETGIQNTGIAIFLLRFSLPQPEADLTTIAPVAVAVMSPFPLLLMFVYKKIMERNISEYQRIKS